MVSWTHPEEKAVSRQISDALVTQLPSSSRSGDAFHLIPRAVALCTSGLENFTVQLGLGKWITSVTMTIFYVVLYHIWRERYQVKGHKITTACIVGGCGSNDRYADDS